MKALLFILSFSFGILSANGQTKPALKLNPKQETLLLETACGQCKFDLTGHGCDLAVRVDGKAYFVDGTSLDDHGDAHAKDGFCQAIRQAKVQGQVVDNRFKVTYFELLPAQPAAKPSRKL